MNEEFVTYLDLGIFVIYFLAVLGVGIYFFSSNENEHDYFVGSRQISSWHIGLSVVATDVGGGFSIGLGGLGFIMGLSGSWMLFTGLLGAWLSGVFLIPRVWKIANQRSFTTFPELIGFLYDSKAALVAAVISLVGYLGFTSSQILAGAKLMNSTFPEFSRDSLLILMGVIIVGYTVLGGIKAVIYTDTIQWGILLIGLIFAGIPFSVYALGGWCEVINTLPPEMLSLSNLSWSEMVNWAITIIPIWFVGMTLYQRIYASRSEKEAKKAWFIAGVFEYPIMAFLGVVLGMLARAASIKGLLSTDISDPEMGLPLLLKDVLPAGALGLLMAAYFSAIMSTADSCLMAASGNLVGDIFSKRWKSGGIISVIRLSQLSTLLLGVIAVLISITMTNVLDLMLLSYAFMVSGLLVPLVAGVFFKRNSSVAAISAMLGGGSVVVLFELFSWNLPYDLDPNLAGIVFSFLTFFTIDLYTNKQTLKST